MTPETVCFDVGGVKHEVSRALVELYPNTLLAQLVSERWQKADQANEICIDRDGNLFSYILAYMKDKRAYLPLLVSKEAIMKELDYFGFEGVFPEAIICNDKIMAACKKAVYETEYRKARDAVKEAKQTQHYVQMAYQCFENLGRNGTYECPFGDSYVHPVDSCRFNEHLAKYGLKLKSSGKEGNILRVTVTRL